MSTLVENVAKVTAAHAALKTAIAAKGVAVPDGTKLSGMPALVEQIQTGGATEPQNMPRAVFAYTDGYTFIVPKTLVMDMTAMTDLSYCFYNCRRVTSLSLPAGFGQAATNLSYCFRNCSALQHLTLPAGFGQAATNLSYCFGCSNLLSLTLPAGCGQNATDLGYCFYECAALTSLTLPAGFGQKATSLYNCFNSSYVLTSLTLPAGFGQNATSIGYCFYSCYKLASLTLPDGFGQVATGLYNCFHGCSALTTITGNPNFKSSLSLSPCPNLTHDSLMVVINGLQTVATSQTLTLGTTNLAKLSDAEKKVATDKGWTLA